MASFLGGPFSGSSTGYSPDPNQWLGQLKGGLIGANLSSPQYSCNTNMLRSSNTTKGLSNPGVQTFQDDLSEVQISCNTLESNDVEDFEVAAFDMETQWGESRTHKVKEVEFKRKELIHSFDIYYASRESLVLMGVDLGTEKRVSFPESFKETKFAKPPKGWRA